MDKKKIEKRDQAIDILRIAAIACVTGIHTTSRSLELVQLDILHYPLLFIINQLFRLAVPLFFLISGYVLEYRYKDKLDTKNFYLRRVHRILLPYLVWTILYFITNEKLGNGISFLTDIVSGGAANQLYFIPAIFLLYLLFPLIHQYKNYFLAKKQLIILVVVSLFLLFCDYYLNLFGFLPTVLRASLLNLYIFILGMFAAHKIYAIQIFTKKHMKLLSLICITSAILVVVIAQNLYLSTHKIQYIYDQWRPTLALFALSSSLIAYVLLQRIVKNYLPFVALLSQLSLFVFFSHLLFFNYFWTHYVSWIFEQVAGHVWQTYILNGILFVLLLVMTFMIGYLISFIPLLNRLFGIEKIQHPKKMDLKQS